MSGHRRVKNVGYDDDDFEDDYDEYDEYEGGEAGTADAGGQDDMTAEDREQLRQGTVEVKAALGNSSQISDLAIQEALWHYWFDVDKTIIYLKNQEQPKSTPKLPKVTSRFDQAAAASAVKAESTLATGSNGKLSQDSCRLGSACVPDLWHSRLEIPTAPTFESGLFSGLRDHAVQTATSARSSSAAFFKDIPWTDLPPERITTFTPTDRRPNPRLLGGSGKPSKLAALAAARKAKENKSASNAPPASSSDAPQPSSAISLLDRLGSKHGSSLSSESSLLKRPKTDMPAPGAASRLNLRPKKPPTPPTPEPKTEEVEATKKIEAGERSPVYIQPLIGALNCSPSSFASDLCGDSSCRFTPFGKLDFCTNMSAALFGSVDPASVTGFSGPSPDDIVIQAQTKGKVPASKKKENGITKATQAVDDLNIDDLSGPIRDRPKVATKIQSKNLDVLQEYKKAQRKKESNFVVVGHIDHGKSTLMGRLLYEHKVIDQRSLDKFRKEAAKIGKESFALAWVMDAREDEREHGVTIDYAEKNFETEKADFTILDAPGHRDFVGNMIAGTSMADFALLVIDAGTNSFEAGLKGQTREHAQVVRCMKLERLVIAVNKMDTVSWSQEAFDSVRKKATAVLAELLFDPANLVFVPCSGLTGENITAPPTKQAPWYTGPTLVQALESLTPDRTQYLGAPSDPFRLRISGFTGLSEYSEFATSNAHEPFTAFGRLDAGNIQVGDQIVCQPGGETAVVKGITRHGKAADWAVAGHIVGLQLSDCDEERFAKGDLLCAIAKPAKPVTAVTMKVLAFDAVFPMPVDVHRGRLRVQANITQLVAQVDGKTHKVVKEGPKVVKHGGVARVKVEFAEPVALERKTRVVLRYGGETIAAGAVERGH
ncbi:hypothetical protein K461DRAFT_270960 [Myriangium duriaei CBS 260.36]|uniref:Elongation factor 1 alpha-like protein n=1 Tax=Myriangium duriaei CBS 260.36 TaxID=1168546 RepID=A0A9P4IWZ0_9PEZI|nr:hypothetical protein K461DRAFT_270960 [Myriangium duriaei CBS 260.36]